MKKIKLINITNLIKQYGSSYVAKDKKSGKVVAHAARVDTLLKKIVTDKKKDTVISWVPKHNARYVFRVSICIR